MALELMRFRRLVVGFGLVLAMALAMVGGSTSVRAQAADTGYVLGPNDSIQVIVYGQTEFNVTTRIKADGTIVMPLIGSVKAAGQTNIGLAKVIADRLDKEGLLKSPIVNVEYANFVSQTVNVAGKVGAPGIVPLDRPYRVLEVLLKSGWVRENAAYYVYLRRPGQPEQRLEVADLVRGGADKDPVLRPGDTLFVPDADLVFLTGQVGRPGPLPIQPNMTIREALATAGGISATGSANKVGLIRGTNKEIDVETSQLVQKNDVIIVKERMF